MIQKLISVLGSLVVLSGAAVEGASGVAYTATNAPAGNEVLVFARAADGTLTFEAAVPTGGLGTGTGLGNQGGLRLAAGGRFLLVVNAGSDDVSVFRRTPAGLVLTSRVPSGGKRPVSIAIDDRLIYVLNAGGDVGEADASQGSTSPPLERWKRSPEVAAR